MKYPEYFYEMTTTFMSLPKSYQEFLVRWYYYDHSEDSKIPDTVPVENIENYIVEHMNSSTIWCAKGFAAARNVDENNDNLEFKNDGEFHIFCLYIAKLIFKNGVENNWFSENISKKEFLEQCYALKGIVY
jgi:hypothetical protein